MNTLQPGYFGLVMRQISLKNFLKHLVLKKDNNPYKKNLYKLYLNDWNNSDLYICNLFQSIDYITYDPLLYIHNPDLCEKDEYIEIKEFYVFFNDILKQYDIEIEDLEDYSAPGYQDIIAWFRNFISSKISEQTLNHYKENTEMPCSYQYRGYNWNGRSSCDLASIKCMNDVYYVEKEDTHNTVNDIDCNDLKDELSDTDDYDYRDEILDEIIEEQDDGIEDLDAFLEEAFIDEFEATDTVKSEPKETSEDKLTKIKDDTYVNYFAKVSQVSTYPTGVSSSEDKPKVIKRKIYRKNIIFGSNDKPFKPKYK